MAVRWACVLCLLLTLEAQAFHAAPKCDRLLLGDCILRYSSIVAGGIAPVRVITSKLFLSHKPPTGVQHPECPKRLELAWERLKRDDMAIEW